MFINDRGHKFRLPKNSDATKAIRLVLRGWRQQEAEQGVSAAEDSFNRLWRELQPRHRTVLEEIARYPDGLSQEDLEKAVGISAHTLRARNIAISKISKRVEVSYPIRQAGYARNNRRFYLDPDVQRGVLRLAARRPRKRRGSSEPSAPDGV